MTTPSPISDQAAGEREAFLKWFGTSGFWNDAITGKAWTAACKWQREQLTAPTTGSAPQVAECKSCGASPDSWLCPQSTDKRAKCHFAASASPAASVLSDAELSEIDTAACEWTDDWSERQELTPSKEACNAMFIRRVIALLAASMGRDKS